MTTKSKWNGDALREWRERLGFTSAQKAAVHCGFDRGIWAKWEDGTTPGGDRLAGILRGLEIQARTMSVKAPSFGDFFEVE